MITDNWYTRSRTELPLVCIILLLPYLFCSQINTPEIPYVPSVVFEGYINGGTVKFEGNPYYPNACSLQSDTMILFLCSDNYIPAGAPGTPEGSYMRLLILPFRDTLPRTKIATEDIIFHYASHDIVTQSYEVVPKDSISRFDRYVRMDIESFTRTEGSTLSLVNLRVRSPVMQGTTGREPLVIDSGSVYGTVSR